jgi:microcystin-dependent protein
MADHFIGEIRIFGGTFAPAGWAFCDGSLVSVSKHRELFELLGTHFGGNGQTQFALPDLRGRMPIHIGQGKDLSPRTLGEIGGVEKVTLTKAQLPKHQHTPVASSANGNSDSCGGNYWSKSVSSTQFAPDSANSVLMDTRAIAVTGGNQAHDNMLPFLALNFIIALG